MGTLASQSYLDLVLLGFMVGGGWKIGQEVVGRAWDGVYGILESLLKPKK